MYQLQRVCLCVLSMVDLELTEIRILLYKRAMTAGQDYKGGKMNKNKTTKNKCKNPTVEASTVEIFLL